MTTPRERFLAYVRSGGTTPAVVSPFLPHPSVVRDAAEALHLPVTGDPVRDEVTLSGSLDYEPMFMTGMDSLIFPWEPDEESSKLLIRTGI